MAEVDKVNCIHPPTAWGGSRFNRCLPVSAPFPAVAIGPLLQLCYAQGYSLSVAIVFSFIQWQFNHWQVAFGLLEREASKSRSDPASAPHPAKAAFYADPNQQPAGWDHSPRMQIPSCCWNPQPTSLIAARNFCRCFLRYCAAESHPWLDWATWREHPPMGAKVSVIRLQSCWLQKISNTVFACCVPGWQSPDKGSNARQCTNQGSRPGSPSSCVQSDWGGLAQQRRAISLDDVECLLRSRTGTARVPSLPMS